MTLLQRLVSLVIIVQCHGCMHTVTHKQNHSWSHRKSEGWLPIFLQWWLHQALTLTVACQECVNGLKMLINAFQTKLVGHIHWYNVVLLCIERLYKHMLGMLTVTCHTGGLRYYNVICWMRREIKYVDMFFNIHSTDANWKLFNAVMVMYM